MTPPRSAPFVDPGGDLDRIEAAIREQGVTVEKILLTHGHVDHAAGRRRAARAASACRSRARIRPTSFCSIPCPETAANYGLDAARPVTPDRWLDEGDAVTVGGLGFDILHCPRPLARQRRVREPGTRASPSSATWCSRARSAAPTCRGGNHEQLIPRHQGQGPAAGRRRRLHPRPRTDQHPRCGGACPTPFLQD